MVVRSTRTSRCGRRGRGSGGQATVMQHTGMKIDICFTLLIVLPAISTRIYLGFENGPALLAHSGTGSSRLYL